MPNEIKIDIQRTGFPVKIGTIELWFDSSLEGLRKYIDAEELAKGRVKEAQEQAQKLHLPNLDEIDVENLDIATIDAAIDVNKEFIAAQYDIIFGDGTFERIYKAYPDIMMLERILDEVGKLIAERIGELEDERKEQTEAKKAEYLQKKAIKK